MLQFFRFYKPTLLRTIPILGVAANRYVTGPGVVSFVATLFNPEIGWPEVSRWWATVPLLALLAFGFLRALQERFEGLEEKLASEEKRAALNNLLGDAYEEGQRIYSILQ